MNYKALIKKQSTIIAIAVICLTIATVGVSFALFFQVETNSNNQLVTAGTLNVEYGSGSSAISATELVPLSDDEALSSSTMTGTIYIENKGSLPAKYEVKIGNDTKTFNDRDDAKETDKLLSHEYIRIAAYLNGDEIVAPAKLADIEYASDDETMHSLFTNLINTTGTGDNTATIVLKIWIAENAPEDIIGDFVYLKMDVTSEVANANALPAEGTPRVALTDSAGENLVDYKIYGESVQNGTPTPDTPIEVESVGDKTDNLLDLSKVKKTTDLSINENGDLISTGYPVRLGVTLSVLCPELKVGDVVTLKGETDARNEKSGTILNRWYMYGDDTSFTWRYGSTITITQDILDSEPAIYCTMDANSNKLSATHSKLEIKYEGVDSEYEPYGYKIPVKVSGKNLVNWNNTPTQIDVDGAGTMRYGYKIPLSAGTYTISGSHTKKIDLYAKTLINNVYGSTKTIFQTDVLSGSKTLDLSADGYLLIWTSISKNDIGNWNDLKAQVEIGTTSTEYESYVEPIITNIHLNEPLRKIGDYADYIDFVNQKVVRKIAHKSFNGSENWSLINSGSYYQYRSANDHENVFLNSRQMSTHFPYQYLSSVDFIHFYVSNSTGACNITSDKPTLEEFTNWLLEQSSSGKPVEIYYPKKKTTEEEIQLPNIPTIKGTAIVSVDTEIQPSNIEVVYNPN